MIGPILDAEQWADLHAWKLDVLIASLGDSPAFAGEALMLMDIDAAEARAVVTEAIVPMFYVPVVADTIRALMPVVESWLAKQAGRGLFYSEDAEARIWLWAVIFAWGWARQETAGDDG